MCRVTLAASPRPSGFSSAACPHKPKSYGVIPGRTGIRGRIGRAASPAAPASPSSTPSSTPISPNVGSATQAGAIWVTGSGPLTIGGAGLLTVNGATVDGYTAAGIVVDNSAATLSINNQISFGGLDGSNNPLGIVQVNRGTLQINSGGMLTNTNEINVGDTLGATGNLVMTGGTVSVLLGGNTYNTSNYYYPGVYVGSQGGTGNLTLSGNSLLDAGSNWVVIGVQDIATILASARSPSVALPP